MTTKTFFLTSIVSFSIGLSATAATYSGNGDTSFGGPVGLGNLVVTDDGVNLTFTLNSASALGGNDLVVYLDTVSGGFSSTAGFTDAADGGRKAISGYTAFDNGGGAGRSTLNFATGFTADYALDIGNTYASLFTLANGGDNSLTYDTGTGQGGSSPYSLTVSLASLGLTAGQSFGLFGTLISESGYRSTETVAGTETGSQGWGNTITQATFSTYTTTAVPEPTSLVLGASGAALFYFIRRRR